MNITTPDMASDELNAWVHKMADNIADAGLTFVDGQQFAGIPYIPAPHHNARPPVKVRNHERRKRWGDLQRHDALHTWVCFRSIRDEQHKPYLYPPNPEPDGA